MTKRIIIVVIIGCVLIPLLWYKYHPYSANDLEYVTVTIIDSETASMPRHRFSSNLIMYQGDDGNIYIFPKSIQEKSNGDKIIGNTFDLVVTTSRNSLYSPAKSVIAWEQNGKIEEHTVEETNAGLLASFWGITAFYVFLGIFAIIPKFYDWLSPKLEKRKAEKTRESNKLEKEERRKKYEETLQTNQSDTQLRHKQKNTSRKKLKRTKKN